MEQDEAWLAEGVARFEAGDLPGAEELLRRIGVSSYLCRDALLALSRVLEAAKQPAEAMRCAEEADNLESDARSCCQLARLLLARRDVAGAQAMIERALRLDARHADAHVLLGQLERSRGRGDDALRAFEAAVRLDDGHLEARYQLAKLLFDRQDLGRAGAQVETLLQRKADHAGAIALASALARLEQQAREALQAAVPMPRPEPTAAPAPATNPGSAHSTRSSGTGMLESLQQRLRDKLKDGEGKG